MPVHITSGIAGRAARFAGSAASDTRSKWKAISGAVASVAATVSAAPMRSGSGSARIAPARGRASTKMPATAAKLSCHPTSCQARGSHAEGQRGGQQQRVPARRRAAGEGRHDGGHPHHPCPQDRRPGARDGHVERDQDRDSDQAAPPAQPGRREQRPRQRRQQGDVLPADRQHVREPGGLEVVAHGGRDVLVGAEHHAARQRAHRGRQPGAHAPLRPPPDRVEHSRHAVAPARRSSRARSAWRTVRTPARRR